MGAVAEEGDGIEGGVSQVFMVVYFLQHQNNYLIFDPILIFFLFILHNNIK